MLKTKQNGTTGQGPEMPPLQELTEQQVRQFIEKDMKAAKDMLAFILSSPEILDMVATYATGLHNNRVNAQKLKES